MPSVYCIINKKNWKGYIGIVKDGDIERRFKEHIKSSRQGKSILHKAFRKYGSDKFILYRIEDIENWDTCCAREVDLIREYTLQPLGYNTYAIGYNQPIDKTFSEETRRKLSRAHRRYWSVDREKKSRRHGEFIRTAISSMSEEQRKARAYRTPDQLKSLGEKIKTSYARLPLKEKKIRARKNSSVNLKRNPNIDRILETTDKPRLYWSAEGRSQRIADAVDTKDQCTYGQLEIYLAEKFPDVPSCVNPNGIIQYWRDRIYGMIKKGHLKYSDGLPHISGSSYERSPIRK